MGVNWVARAVAITELVGVVFSLICFFWLRVFTVRFGRGGRFGGDFYELVQAGF